MTRIASTLLLGLITLAVSPSTAVSEENGENLKKCAKTCSECQLVCDACFKHCLTLTAGGKKEHEKTAQMCADCAECCKACATLCARQSPLAGYMLKCCAECCKECATACEKFSDDKLMAECAKVCRECAKECASTAK